jgi:hypothetical protein
MTNFIILYSLPDIIRVMKSRMVRYVGHVVCMGDMRNSGNLTEETTWKTQA